MGEKHEQKILKGIEDYRRISGRFHLDQADVTAQKLIEHLSGTPGIEKITPAGFAASGRETVGDLDILVTENHGARPPSEERQRNGSHPRRHSPSPASLRCSLKATTK